MTLGCCRMATTPWFSTAAASELGKTAGGRAYHLTPFCTPWKQSTPLPSPLLRSISIIFLSFILKLALKPLCTEAHVIGPMYVSGPPLQSQGQPKAKPRGPRNAGGVSRHLLQCMPALTHTSLAHASTQHLST